MQDVSKMDEKIHMVPVPASALPAVYELLARLTAKGNAEERSSAWVASDMKELAALIKNPAGRAIVTAIARRAARGEKVSYEQLRSAAAKVVSGFTYSRVQAQLSWLAKYCKKLKGDNTWPLEVETVNDAPKGERYLYTMNKDLAEAWLEAV